MDFSALGIGPFFSTRLAERGITEPTEIQNRVIPRLLSGGSLIFSSATGTGKTFAYLLPLLERLASEPGAGGPRLLVLAPTFELCVQIKAEADFLLAPEASGPEGEKAPSLRCSLLIGGANLTRQIETLRSEKPAIIVGNPGRVLLLARMGKIKTRFISALVLDEGDFLAADELFGETGELLRLLRPLQITACSATMPPKSRERLLPFMPPERGADIDEDEAEVLRERITHWAIWTGDRRKVSTLRSFLAAAKPRKALVFTARSADVGAITAQLQYHHLAAGGLHGKMDKKSRRLALEDFRRGRLSVLVTSDLAARGLDIAGVSHVVALDVPQEGGAYLHRAGRTARAGKQGIMVTLGDAEEMRALARLEKKLRIVVYPRELYQGSIVSPEAG